MHKSLYNSFNQSLVTRITWNSYLEKVIILLTAKTSHRMLFFFSIKNLINCGLLKRNMKTLKIEFNDHVLRAVKY